jgi:mono/diheme cytochrome c family protein
MKAFPFLLVLWSLLLTSVMLPAQTSSDATLTGTPVYQKNCAKCHGKTAEGRHFGGPSLISEKTAAASAGDLNSIITNGKGHMPKYVGKLTTEEIDTLAQQIKELNTKK